MSYKKTLLLPKSAFPMKADLVHKEPERQQKWWDSNVWRRMRDNRQGAPFVLHDGPPYANGDIHIGHALNKILKDFVVKYHYFGGEAVDFRPGWDCHGLPIEQQVVQKLESEWQDYQEHHKYDWTLEEADKHYRYLVRERCRDHAETYVTRQRDQFKRLGVVANWDAPYLTMNYEFEADVFKTLAKLANKGLVYEQKKPVYWSWKERTALAEAEIDYREHTSLAGYFSFPIQKWRDTPLKRFSDILKNDPKIVVWTTTPWTLAGNTGIAIHPKKPYVLTSNGCIVAAEAFKYLADNGIIDNLKIAQFYPHELNNLACKNPLTSLAYKLALIDSTYDSKIILSDTVDVTEGTGCVHLAPGHGEADYQLGLEHKLRTVMPVDENGRYSEAIYEGPLGVPPPVDSVFMADGVSTKPGNKRDWCGMHVFDASKRIKPEGILPSPPRIHS